MKTAYILNNQAHYLSLTLYAVLLRQVVALLVLLDRL